jgi:hypothetical protein
VTPVTLDVTDPNIKYIGDTDFSNPDPEAADSGLTVAPEGNGHEAEFTLDNRHVIGADEDFGPYAVSAKNSDDSTAITAGQGQTPHAHRRLGIRGTRLHRRSGGPRRRPERRRHRRRRARRMYLHREGRQRRGRRRLRCRAHLQPHRLGRVRRSARHQRRRRHPGVWRRTARTGIRLLDQPYGDADCLAGTGPDALPVEIGTKGDTLTLSSYFDGWGYAHLYRNQGGKMTELDTYAIPDCGGPPSDTGGRPLQRPRCRVGAGTAAREVHEHSGAVRSMTWKVTGPNPGISKRAVPAVTRVMYPGRIGVTVVTPVFGSGVGCGALSSRSVFQLRPPNSA